MAEDKTGTKELTGKEKRQLNLQPLESLDKERQREIRSLGGKARQEQIRQRKTMKETMLAILEAKMSKETAKKYLGADADNLTDDDLTGQGILSARMWKEACENGSAKAAEFCRDTSGQRPKDLLEVSGNVISDADRALMANLSKRLCKTTEENGQK